ncbi:hypothetical protein EON65_54475, partial [archaeon]
MIDEIWASMNAEQEEIKKTIAKKKKTLKPQVVLEAPVKPQEDVITLLSAMGIAKPTIKKK